MEIEGDTPDGLTIEPLSGFWFALPLVDGSNVVVGVRVLRIELKNFSIVLFCKIVALLYKTQMSKVISSISMFGVALDDLEIKLDRLPQVSGTIDSQVCLLSFQEQVTCLVRSQVAWQKPRNNQHDDGNPDADQAFPSDLD